MIDLAAEALARRAALVRDDGLDLALLAMSSAIGIDATTVADLRVAGASDPEVFGAAVAGGYAVLTENVGDFARIAAEHSRRTPQRGPHSSVEPLLATAGRSAALIDAVQAVADRQIEDRVIYLEPAGSG